MSINEVKILERPETITYDELCILLKKSFEEWAKSGIIFGAYEQTKEEIERRIGDRKCFVAMIDEKLAGTITLYFKEDGKTAGIALLAVAPEYKRFGIGKKLLKHAEEYARLEGRKRIVLDTSIKAKWLVKWYCKKNKYQKCGIIENYGRNYLSVLMSKNLENEGKWELALFLRYIKGVLKHTLKVKVKSLANIFWFIPGRKNIIFESIPNFADNARAIFDEMVKRNVNKKYKLVWITVDENNENGFKCISTKGILNNIKRIYYFSRAKGLITCNRQYRKINPKTFSICLCHGSKNKKTRGKYELAKDLDCVLIQAPVFADVTRYEYNLSESTKLVDLGFPRNDLLLNESDINLCKILGKKDMKVIVWYPTFRQHKNTHNTSGGSAMPIIYDYETAKALDKCAKENNVLIVLKPHFVQDTSYIRKHELENVIFIDDEFLSKNNIKSYELLGMSDALITDYSSVFYDYLLTDKPICLTWDDFEEYKHNFPFDPYEMYEGGNKVYNIDELNAFVENVAKGVDPLKEERLAMKKKCNTYTDNSSTKRVTDFILESIK